MRVSGIGSRQLNPYQLNVCEKLGYWVVLCGYELHSGNAEKADQAFARGGNLVDPTKVHLHLPWPGFNEEAIVFGNVIHQPPYPEAFAAIAEDCHPVWSRLSDGQRKLHIRNVSIIMPYDLVDLVLAWPSSKRGGGGTGQGIRIAKKWGVRVVDLSQLQQEDLYKLCEELRQPCRI